MKEFVPYLDVMLLLVFKTSTVDSPNFLHTEIFGFIRIDFSSFAIKEISSVFHIPKSVFFTFKVTLKS